MGKKGFIFIEFMLIVAFMTFIGFTTHTVIVNMYPDKEYPHLTVGKVKEYKVLEKALVDGGTEALINDASKVGCFDWIKIVDGKEVKNCWGAIKPAYGKWECKELSRREAPQCYEEVRGNWNSGVYSVPVSPSMQRFLEDTIAERSK